MFHKFMDFSYKVGNFKSITENNPRFTRVHVDSQMMISNHPRVISIAYLICSILKHLLYPFCLDS